MVANIKKYAAFHALLILGLGLGLLIIGCGEKEKEPEPPPAAKAKERELPAAAHGHITTFIHCQKTYHTGIFLDFVFRIIMPLV